MLGPTPVLTSSKWFALKYWEPTRQNQKPQRFKLKPFNGLSRSRPIHLELSLKSTRESHKNISLGEIPSNLASTLQLLKMGVSFHRLHIQDGACEFFWSCVKLGLKKQLTRLGANLGSSCFCLFSLTSKCPKTSLCYCAPMVREG